jgi:hypothetical protein
VTDRALTPPQRLDWAETRFLDLDREMRNFFARFKNGETHSLDKVRDRETGFRIYRLVVREQIPTETWALRVSEILHHARACLDNLVYALVVSHAARHGERPSPAITRVSAFPLIDDPALFWERDRRGEPTYRSGVRKIEGIDPAAQKIVETLQPYERNGDLPQALLALDLFWNADKHRVTPIAATVGQHLRVEITGDAFTGTASVGGVPLFMREHFPFEDGAEVARYRPLADDMDMVMQSEFALRIRFPEGREPWAARDVGAFTKWCLDAVRHTIARFEGYL